MRVLQRPTIAERDTALDYLMSLKFENGKTFASYCGGDIDKRIPINFTTIAGIMASYHRDMTPFVPKQLTGRRFKEG